ncbi:MAG: hypothetical protein U1F07_03880 [Rubrivivax sp.]|jgi:hypothetical protein
MTNTVRKAQPGLWRWLYAAMNFVIGLTLAFYAVYAAHANARDGADWAGLMLYIAGLGLCAIELARTPESRRTIPAAEAGRQAPGPEGRAALAL